MSKRKPIPAKTRAALKARAGQCCERCGKWTDLYEGNAHHRRNQSQGGGHELSNLMWLCGSGTTGCHGWVTRNPKAAHKLGYTLRGVESTSRPVSYRYGVQRVLTDDGLTEAAA